MPYSIDEDGFGGPLPSDVTLSTPTIYRRRGILASLFSAIGTWFAERRRDRARRISLEEIPDWLRRDLGLPVEPRERPWWQNLRF